MLTGAIALQNNRTLLRVFGGLNETYGCSEAEYGKGKNFSGRDYPALSTRVPRRKMWTVNHVNGMHHLNGLLVIHDTTLEYTPEDPESPVVILAGQLENSRKVMVSMGVRVIIWPDKMCFDTVAGTLTALDNAEKVPALDFAVEFNNRIWGCNSSENVIYASKLGNPAVWDDYSGTAADSYAVTVGSEGPFTGAAVCMGQLLFFKESVLHKIFGSEPEDYQLNTVRCRGVAKNADRSMCVINEVLYYMSPAGVMAWEGGMPRKVSQAMDPETFANADQACSGHLDGRYYLHIAKEDRNGVERGRLLVYDTERGLWHEEDAGAFDMASTGRQLYLWIYDSIYAADPGRERDAEWAAEDAVESRIEFEWISGDIGLDNPDDKYISRVTLRMDAERSTYVKVWASYDGREWKPVEERAVKDAYERMDMPFVPERCDSFRLRINGAGRVTLRSIGMTLAGSRGKIVQ